jgi:hypothetical protein
MMMPAPDISFRHIKPMMQAELMGLLNEWGLAARGRRDGKYFVCPNPQRGDDRAGSFKIWLSGPAAGCFKEFDSGGTETGDIIDLPVYAGVLKDRKEVFDWAVHRYGLASGDAKAVARKVQQAEASAKKMDEDAEAERRAKIGTAKRLFQSARPIYGTRGWEYLTQARGLPLGNLPGRLSDDIRFSPSCLYRDARGPEAWLPAMICAMRDHTGELVAVHRTYLTPPGLPIGKADVPSAKKMLGATKGASIRVWTGRAVGHVILTEGIEDAMAVACSLPEAVVYACGSLNGLASWTPPEGDPPEKITVMADNDWSHGPAARGFEKAKSRLVETGIPIAVVRVPMGKDANDFLKGETT